MIYVYVLGAALVVNILVSISLCRLVFGYKYHDPMTQLYNKKYLRKIITRWIRRKKDFTVCFFDIDKFKRLNDTYGHLAGDKGIIHLSEVMKKCFKGKAVAARIGGDEFAAAFIGFSTAKQEDIFNRIRSQSYEYNGKIISYTVSIGVCRSNRELSYEKMLEMTDKKLYDNKKNLKNMAYMSINESSHLCKEECAIY